MNLPRDSISIECSSQSWTLHGVSRRRFHRCSSGNIEEKTNRVCGREERQEEKWTMSHFALVNRKDKHFCRLFVGGGCGVRSDLSGLIEKNEINLFRINKLHCGMHYTYTTHFYPLLVHYDESTEITFFSSFSHRYRHLNRFWYQAEEENEQSYFEAFAI